MIESMTESLTQASLHVGQEVCALEMVETLGKALIGRTIETERIGSYPGGPAKVTELEPDPESPEIVLQVLHPTFGTVGVFGDELVSLLS